MDVEVRAPMQKTVDVSAALKVKQGWRFSDVAEAAETAVRAYFTGERLGENIYGAKLASILYGTEGVENCHLLAPTEDISVSATELPMLGTLTLSELEDEQA